jgi:hypothetical protein
VDLLAARDDVDGASITAIGKRSGTVPLLYAAVLDERLGRVGFEEMLVSYRSVVEQRIHRNVLESIIPGVLKQFDLPELVASLAPRQALLVNPVNPLGNRLRADAARASYSGAGDSVRVALRRAEDGPEQVFGDWRQPEDR